jgi:class 3 adenylate cyclase/tetratricopeptide (TPR) repeat protein
MSTEQQQLEAGIQALEVQRSLLGDAVVDALLAPARARLAALCAASSSAAPDLAQTLKQVSILFLDVVGSTTLAQRLDPEGISAVMDDALARGTAVVEQHGGKVLQYAGDNILAAFGSEASAEDDAERAVRCGLALLALGRTLGAEVQAMHGHAGFNVRVGLHTGGVLLGGGVDAEGTIRGIAVNIAARMEQTAPAGALRISHDTYVHVRGAFDVEAQAPLSVKGVDAPIQSYLVNGARPRSFRIGTRGIEGVVTRTVGRDAELQALQGAFERLFRERALAIVTVVADAGIGKSRLLYEFDAWMEARSERVVLFRGRASPQTGSQAYGLLRDILAWRFQIADDDSIAVARQKMEDGIVPLFVHDDGPELAEGHAHLLGHLIGIDWKESRHLRGSLDEPGQIRRRALHVADQLFRRLSAREGSPVILQLEDLHWADGESLHFLSHLVEVNRDVPMLVLAFTRPTLFERRTEWSGTSGQHQRIDLQPLDRLASRQLADELLQRLPETPVALRELLASSAEGNPFYMEELVKMLVDQGAIQTGDAWRVDAERLLVTKVPSTLTGVLQARLDGLPAPERRALQQASVVGAVFWDRALAAVDELAIERLPALTRRELTVPRPEAPLEGLREYAFRHQMLHQVTYGTVLKRTRREGHAKVAQWLAGLAEQGSARAGDLLGLAAEHFEHAGDAVQAAEFHARAAEHAGQRLAHERVLDHVGRALALQFDTPEPARVELRWRLFWVREHALDLQARRDEQAADLDALEQLAERLDDDRRRAEVARRRSGRAMRMGDWAAQARAARHGLACGQRAGEDKLRLTALRMLAFALVMQGEIDTGRELAMQGLAEVRALRLGGIEALLLNTLAIAAERQGDDLGGLDFHQQSLLIFRETGQRVNEAIALMNLGGSWLILGQLPKARQHLDAALQLLRANGDRTMEGAALAMQSTLAHWRGEETQALALARQALEIAVAAQAREEEVSAGMALGAAELALGRTAGARQSFTQAHRLALSLDDLLRHDASAGLARVALREADTVAALAALQPVFDVVAAGGGLKGVQQPRLIEWTCHQALSRAGDPSAVDWLARAHTSLMAQADAISDSALREGFLQNIPHHRAIEAEWARHMASGDGSAERKGLGPAGA